MKKPLTLILGGGKGTRLLPLTQKRAKPDVPLAGRYRLVDIPISNCLHAGFDRIYVLTQFNSASLNAHITSTYRFASFEKSFVEVLAAEQTYEHGHWYRGTADAVRQCLPGLWELHSPSHYLILSGDQLYRMDLKELYRRHVQSRAEVTVAATPVSREQAAHLGILRMEEATGRVTGFLEKPGPDLELAHMAWAGGGSVKGESPGRGGRYLASMGIYLFRARALQKALDNELCDFGSEVLPQSIGSQRVFAYLFDGYWADVGTVATFYEANLRLTEIQPPFNFYDEDKPIFTTPTNLPASKVNSCSIQQSLTSEGCIITDAVVRNSIVGVRMIIGEGAALDGVVAMGNDRYEDGAERERNRRRGIPALGIGRGSRIRRTIIDQNARIGAGCRIGVDEMGRENGHYKTHSVVDGIIVIRQNAVIPDGTVL